MSLTIKLRPLHVCLSVAVLLLLPMSAYPQATLTGAVQFSTNSAGATSGPWVWNTLAGDSYWDLWLALNPDATSPVNGPSDAQAGISIPLDAGKKYRFYLFGSGSCCTSFNGLNLFFDGNDSVPGISVFGPTNSSDFLANGNSTLTLAGAPMPGSASTVYSADGVVVVLGSYEWHTPQTPPGDVCQALLFSPGDAPDYVGSFTLEVYPEATFSIGQPSGSPGTKLTMTGSGFNPAETVTIYTGHVGLSPLSSTVTDADGSFAITLREPQRPYGPIDFFAVGQTSGKLGVATLVVTPGLIMNPSSGLPGGTTAAEGLGFGAGETVSVYWNNPRQLLGTATANSQGSFTGSSALTITIPPDASPGLNSVIGIGQTTAAIGIGQIEVK